MDPFSFTNRLTVFHQFTGTLKRPPPHDFITGKSIVGWARYKKTEIYVPVARTTGSEEAAVPFFNSAWCDCCSKSVNGSVGKNLDSHCKTAKYMKNTIFSTTSDNTPHTPDIIARKLVQLVLSRGLAFSMIEDPLLKAIAPTLPSRQEVSDIAARAATAIRIETARILQEADTISLTADEWKSRANDRYFGIGAVALMNDNTQRHFLLAMEPITSVHLSGAEVLLLYNRLVEPFNIDDKVQNLVTDRGSNMISAFSNNPSINWHPCVCHVLNNVLGTFIAALGEPLGVIKSLQASLGSSGTFKAFLRSVHSIITTLPAYTSIRWYSMSSLIINITILAPHIRNFIEAEQLRDSHRYQDLPYETAIHHAMELKRVFSEMAAAFGSIEANSFGTVSYVVPAMAIVHANVLALPATYSAAKTAFSNSYESHWRILMRTWGLAFMAAFLLNPNFHHLRFMTEEEISDTRVYLRQEIDRRSTPPSPVQEDSHLSWATSQTRVPTSAQLELDQYLATTFAAEVNLLDYWSRQKPVWPTLSKLAMQLLAIPPSSAFCERHFSKCRHMLGLQRLSMKPEKVSACSTIVGNQEVFSALWDSHAID